MNNLSSYCGLVDAKIRASDKDLPVTSESGAMSSSTPTCGSLSPGFVSLELSILPVPWLVEDTTVVVDMTFNHISLFKGDGFYRR